MRKLAKQPIILIGVVILLAVPLATRAEIPVGDNLLGFYTDPDLSLGENWINVENDETFTVYLCLSGYTDAPDGIMGLNCSYEIVGEGTYDLLSEEYYGGYNESGDPGDLMIYWWEEYRLPLPDNTVTLAAFTFQAIDNGPSEIFLHLSSNPELEGEMSVMTTSEEYLPCGWASGDESSPVFGLNTGGPVDLFPDVASTALVDHTGQSTGAAWGDYDDDGRPDLYVANQDQADVLYHNEGDGTFSQVTGGPLGYAGPTWSGTWGDYDVDGDLDLYLAVTGADMLLRNDGSSVFTDQTSAASLGASGECRDATWGDFDKDGYPDLYVVRSADTNLLYQNNGDGTFTDVSAAPLDDVDSDESATWADFDGDGDPDLFLTSSTVANKLLRNNGEAGFEDVSSGLPPGFSGPSVSGAWGDYDNDGDLDLYVTNSNVANQLLRNACYDTTVAFVDIAAGFPVGDTGDGSGAAWADYENDGDLDIFVANSSSQPDRLFLNDGGGVFSEAAEPSLAGSWDGQGAAWADYDADGDLDLFVANANQANQLFQNSADGTNNWLQVDLEGIDSAASGSMIRIDAGWQVQTRQVGGGSGWASRNSTTAAFGLGTSNWVNDLIVQWPTGKTHIVPVSMVNQRLTITEPLPMTSVTSSLPNLEAARADWGDYDNDGDLDLAMCGLLGGVGHTEIYENNNGSFSPIGSGLPDVTNGSVAWGDYDRDGAMDLLLTGSANGTRLTNVYRNIGGAFLMLAPVMCPVDEGSAVWGDYDNDGDLDVLLTGNDGTRGVTYLYANDGGVFIDTQTELDQLEGGDGAWGDCDNDGDLDIVLVGELPGIGPVCRVYRNEDGYFGAGIELNGASDGSVAWGDYDGDGDLDILFCGSAYSTPVTEIYLNCNGDFCDSYIDIPGVAQGSARWGDLDGDGDLDIALSGNSGGSPYSEIFLNNGWEFTKCGGTIFNDAASEVILGDYDGDNDLDLLLMGSNGGGNSVFYRNDAPYVNQVPAAPTGLISVWDGTWLNLSWDPSTDDTTPSQALSYNLRVGSRPGASDILTAQADGQTGYMRLAAAGNSGASGFLAIHLPDLEVTGPVYWSVQAVDASFCGSPFSGEEIFEPPMELVAAGLPGVANCAAEWGDYDGDGDLDLFLAGWTGMQRLAAIYRNDSGNFVDIGAGLVPVEGAAAQWGDCDNDGDIDLVVCGCSDMGPLTRIYRNDGGVFSDYRAELPGIQDGSVEWGDYDRDGDLDLLVVGSIAGPLFGVVAKVYGNRNGVFEDAEVGLPQVLLGHGSWFDSSGDGYLSIMLTGWTGSETEMLMFVNDTNGNFIQDHSQNVMGIEDGSVAWGHYGPVGGPNDHGLDLLVSGMSDSGASTRIYDNTIYGLYDVGAGLPGLSSSACGWTDFDNDGDMDIALTGWSDTGPRTFVYHCWNTDQYSELPTGLPGVYGGAANWADFDGDDDMDLLIAGWGQAGAVTRLYRNMLSSPNTPPSSPLAATAMFNDDTLVFQWGPGSDLETPPAALTYNLRVGTTAGQSDILSASADLGSGLRYVNDLGNISTGVQWQITSGNLAWNTEFYWSVQSVDEAFAGSPFTAEQMVSLGSNPSAAPESDLPKNFALKGNYPNPFNPQTSIEFDLPRSEPVRLVIYDPAGRRVRTLVGESLQAGQHKVTWDGKGDSGQPVGSGVYLYKLSAGSFADTRRMTLVR